MKNFLSCFLILFILVSCKQEEQKTKTPPIEDVSKSDLKDPNSMSLFNGKNLDGWTIYGTEKWYVDNGIFKSANLGQTKLMDI